ncbi:PC-esterase domain-containing protein 1A [Lingula anatina]|uniref:PC-esterase domain-containing protein 1A n=1 Tax=Lingula anatina TaxID=7574 RepID=A0A1S3JRF4_LINAN|nr:PC-esterase domain-containing protein 1A [Lingula anatina]XP_013412957.1 PC-esterase domain-containing protein 1A [Lingula anatina]XP_013412965.1 PC-esterase domain-containing protein 1A [Lingula anatina]|eukprot:XP_013412949.1 PC-esterase domain-containing protein 1A [Lingula anatina]
MATVCEIFLTEDVQHLLSNKFVVIIGDSVQRAIYKDLVLLLQDPRYLQEWQLRKKGEFSHVDDKLIEGGQKAVMNNKTNYKEVRQYQTDYFLVRFYFTTRCYNDYVESILRDLAEEPQPDVVIMNSCLWDVTRYGPSSVPKYKENLIELFHKFKKILPDDALVIWNTALPIANNARGGFLIPEVEFMNDTLRLDIMEANYYARQVAGHYGFDVLDLHYYFRRQIHRRAKDGVHWDMTAHRRITNLLLTHISEAWGVELPGRVQKLKLEAAAEKKNSQRQNESHKDASDSGSNSKRYADNRHQRSRSDTYNRSHDGGRRRTQTWQPQQNSVHQIPALMEVASQQTGNNMQHTVHFSQNYNRTYNKNYGGSKRWQPYSSNSSNRHASHYSREQQSNYKR